MSQVIENRKNVQHAEFELYQEIICMLMLFFQINIFTPVQVNLIHENE